MPPLNARDRVAGTPLRELRVDPDKLFYLGERERPDNACCACQHAIKARCDAEDKLHGRTRMYGS
eukprot:gene3279-1289_t